jgi:leucyl-tRNA synthetase/REP element-mobilizing transposase RayT
MPTPYDPSTIEATWQKKWDDAKVYEVDLAKAKNPYMTHVMFPYPSGDKLHVGHWYNFAPADSFARYMKMKGRDVFTPMGFDAFGLPAENYAIKTGVHPSESITENVQTMTKQLKRIGCMYDWKKSLNTSTPEYYKWTQWIFLQMLKNGLAYRKEAHVNFCPTCQTVLANEQVWDGLCERCESEVVQKPLTQWYWKITEYAQRLLDGLEKLDWPEKTKTMQRNWIGRSEGADITFEVAEHSRGWIDCTGQIYGLKPSYDEGSVNRALKGAVNDPLHLSGLQPGRRYVHLTIEPQYRNTVLRKPSTASFLLRETGKVAKRHDIILHEACAMPDHMHLLVSFDSSRHLERDVMQKLKGGSAYAYNKQFGKQGPFWARGKHYEEIFDTEQFQSVLLYIQQNPAKGNIASEGRILSRLSLTLSAFTTTADTMYGMTFLAISPEHPLLAILTSENHKRDVELYVENAMQKTERDRMMDEKGKTGVFTGSHVLHPYTGNKVPLWVADYVLMSYGTGVVMGVPAHDQRDMDFSQKYKLPIVQSIQLENGKSFVYDDVDKNSISGTLIDSGMFTGLSILAGRRKIVEDLAQNGMARSRIQYRLRDWSIGRQRYWGALIPIVYDPEGNPHAIPEKHLPWLLPTDVEFRPTGTAPIAQSKELKERTEKIFGKKWTPEVDTMDTFVCSSFYSYMYLGADHSSGKYKQRDLREGSPVDPKIEKKWMPVQMYIGGAEHACMHLIYSRFVGMALKDFGHVRTDEQYQKLVHQGVITNQGAKMSKSKGNVVSPDGFIEKYGSDVFRMYLMFMGPFTEGGDWSDTGIKGTARFANRIHAFFTSPSAIRDSQSGEEDPKIATLLHKTIKKVGEDIERLHFNTALSALMIFLNEAEKAGSVTKETAITIVQLLAPLAPHLSEELWEALGQKGFVIEADWPSYDESKLVEDTFTLVVQVNGKVRANIEVSADISEVDAIAQAKENENVQKFLEGKAPKKEIYISGKLVSFVI